MRWTFSTEATVSVWQLRNVEIQRGYTALIKAERCAVPNTDVCVGAVVDRASYWQCVVIHCSENVRLGTGRHLLARAP